MKVGRSVYFLSTANNVGYKKYDEFESELSTTNPSGRNDSKINVNFETSSENRSRGKYIYLTYIVSSSELTKQLQNKYKFNEKEITLIKKRYDKIAKQGIMDVKQFQESLGILGVSHASFLSKRIFSIIDRNNKQIVDFEDFVHYLNIIINGTPQQKAQMSFKFLDHENKGFIEHEDIKQLTTDVIIFWNYMTGSRVLPSQEDMPIIMDRFPLRSIHYRNHIFYRYFSKYETLNDILDWYDFFNSDELHDNDLQIPDQKQELENFNQRQLKVAKLDTTLKALQGELIDCLLTVKENRPRFDPKVSTILRASDVNSTFDGPLCINLPTMPKQGDTDPTEEVTENNKQIFTSINESYSRDFNQLRNSSSLDSLSTIEEKIQKILNLMNQEEIQQKKSFSPQKRTSFGTQLKFQQNTRKLSGDCKFQQNPLLRRATMANIPPKKQQMKKNISVYFGHQNWNLILNMMIGMRTAVKTLQPKEFYKEFRDIEYQTKYVHDIITQRSNDFDYRKAFKFIDYSPSIFERIRNQFGITQQLYLRSVGPENMLGNLIMGKLTSLSELSSSGKSGSFFYFTEDSTNNF